MAVEDVAWAWVKDLAALLRDGQLLPLMSWSRAGLDLWKFSHENSAALSQLALVVGIPLLWIRTRAADRQAKAANEHARAAIEQARVANVQARTAEQGHITDRFTKAIEQLGSKEIAVRLGAIYALERLFRDSPEDHWTIMEVLTAYVQENAPWQEDPINLMRKLDTIAGDEADGVTDLGQGPEEGAEPLEAKIRPATVIQAILTVLGRRDEEARKRDDAAGRQLSVMHTLSTRFKPSSGSAAGCPLQHRKPSGR